MLAKGKQKTELRKQKKCDDRLHDEFWEVSDGKLS